MYKLGDIRINGKEYRIDIDSYRVKDLADFSPRASVPGGSIIHSELLLYQPLVMTDWRHGFGFTWHTSAMGYMKTNGNIDTRYPGVASLSTAVTNRHDAGEGATNNSKRGFVEFNNELYSWSVTGLRKTGFHSGVWTSVFAGVINFAFATENWLFYCPENGRIRRMSRAGVHADAGINANSTDYAWLIIYRGFIYAGKRNRNEVYYAEQENLSDLHGAPADDPNMIPIGAGGYPTLGAMHYAGFLYVLRQDGIWSIGEDRIARLVLDFSSEMSSSNFKARTVFNGYMYFNIGTKIYQWNGSRIVDQTPPRMNDVFPYEEIHNCGNMTTANNFLYLTAVFRTTTLQFIHSLFCFDGAGWHKLADLNTGETLNMSSIYHAPTERILYIGWNTNANPNTQHIPIGTGVTPKSPFPITGTHEIITPRLDMGFRRIRKSMPSILVEGSNLSATQRIEISYSIDGGSFVTWGTMSSNGIVEMTLPGGLPTIEFNFIIFRIRLSTADAWSTPILEGLTIRFLLRPDVFYGYNFNIIAAQSYVYGGRQDDRSPAVIFEELKTARNSKAPVEFVDIYDTVRRGYISAVSQMASERHEVSESDVPNIEGRINVNLVEAR
ncbi:MAG: hypothetical protein DDT31_01044 [Syntrophomonadaceae bacterium]|nr:hypothetical protein [Bacillota bacterium]